MLHEICTVIIAARKRSLGQGNIFTPVCHSVHRGACMVAPGGRGSCVVWPGGHAWLLWGGHAWLLGGMHGCSWGGCVVALGGMRGCSGGACMVAPGGACVVAPGGVWLLQGACMVAPGGMRGILRDTEIRSMSGRYTSCWNTFLFYHIFLIDMEFPLSCMKILLLRYNSLKGN